MDKNLESLLDDALGDFQDGGSAGKKPKAFDPLGAGPTKKGGKKKKDVGGGGGGGGAGNPPAGMGATGLPSRASAGAGTASASNTGAPAGMGSMGLPPKKDKGKTAAKAAAAAPTQEAMSNPAGMGSMGLPPKKKKGGGGAKKAGAAAAAAAGAGAFNPYAGMFGGGNPFGGGGNPYAAMGGQGAGDPFGDELSAHMSRMFAGMPQEGDDSQQAAQLQDTLAALNGQSRGAAGAGGAPPAGAPGAEANMMQQMMEAMGGGAGGGMQEMMDNMLQNLLSKETLYEPMVEISKKYPPWIKKNRKTLSAEDVARYEAQLVKVVGIVRAFDEGEKDFAKIVTLLQEMQAFGLPPDEIMHDLSHTKDLPKGPDGKPIIPGLPGLGGGMPPGLGGGGAAPGECSIM
mmetsp:Transcript_26248/g.65737  ORF Transcript_26248/g.65737 Transcript_26248/m.65737 type:complete len:400 (-) Transcript_26248:1709-2908(-)